VAVAAPRRGLGLTARATGPLAASWWKVESVKVYDVLTVSFRLPA
jgi:hypothetical protein